MTDTDNRETREFYTANGGEVEGPYTGYRCGDEPVWWFPQAGFSAHEHGGVLHSTRDSAVREARKQLNRLQETLDDKRANLNP